MSTTLQAPRRQSPPHRVSALLSSLKSSSGWPRRAVWLVVLAGLGALVWEEYLEDRVRPRNWGVVETDAVYRSGRLPLWRARQTLENHRIEVIVDLTLTDRDSPAQQAETVAVRELGIERHRFALCGDSTGDIRQYAAALALLHRSHQARQPVLIHCAQGAQRTGAAIAFYRLLVQQRDPGEVYREMHRYTRSRPSAVLVNYVNDHMRELAELLIQAGVLSELPSPLPRLPD